MELDLLTTNKAELIINQDTIVSRLEHVDYKDKISKWSICLSPNYIQETKKES